MAEHPRAKRLTGNNPFAYMGVNPIEPPSFRIDDRAPTADDVKGFRRGALWLYNTYDENTMTLTVELYILSQIVGNTATWVQLYPSSGQAGATDFITDSGTATQSGGTLQVLGGSNMNTAGGVAGTGQVNQVDNKLNNNVSVSGTVDVVTIDNGVVQNIMGAQLFVTPAEDGQVLISASGSEAEWMTLDSSDNTVTITNGANSINVELINGPTHYITDAGTATTIAGALNYFGDGNTETTAGTNVITVDLASDVSVTSWNVGDGGIIGNDLTVEGTTTFSNLADGIVQNQIFLFADNGSDGELLISSSSGRPAWAEVTSTGGTISINGAANSLDIETTGGGGGGGRDAFLYTQNTTTGAVIGGAAQNYFLGADVVLTEQFDNGSIVFPGDGMGSGAVITIPTTGYWYINAFVTISVPHPPAFTYCDTEIVIVTSNREYTVTDRLYNNNSVPAVIPLTIDIFEQMTAADTVMIYINVDSTIGGTNGVVLGGGSSLFQTYMSGYRVYN